MFEESSSSRKPRLSLLDRLIGLIERKPTSDRVLLRMLLFAILGGILLFGFIMNDRFIEITPSRGGTLVEGVVGTPRFVNPVLAITRADQDVTALLYSGLMRISQSGALENDLAEAISISEDGRTYSVKVREDARFHDGTPVTGRDVVYTISLIQNPDLKSPLRGNWSGVTVEEVSEYELNIVLEEAYTPFIENLTVGILPRHIWKDLPIEQLPFSQHNTEPIGSGSFKIGSVNRDQSGLIDAYMLVPFDGARENPRLDEIQIRFFANEAALELAFDEGEITSTTQLSLTRLASIDTSTYHVIEEPLPRVFGVFYNQNRSTALRDSGAREALDAAIDRKQLVTEVLGGYGLPTHSPVPAGFLGVESEDVSTTTGTSTPLEAAHAILEESGWERDDVGSWVKTIGDEDVVLAITLRTANTALFESTATFVAAAWRELGVEVRVEQYEQADLLQAVIRPRDFEALLFGIDMSRAVDLYPFWHSSQQDDPGLNIAQYTNIDVDALLSDALTERSPEVRIESLTSAAAIIRDEHPALFLFTPTLPYVLNRSVNLAPISTISKPQERFMNVELWHARTESLWPFLRDQSLSETS